MGVSIEPVESSRAASAEITHSHYLSRSDDILLRLRLLLQLQLQRSLRLSLFLSSFLSPFRLSASAFAVYAVDSAFSERALISNLEYLSIV